GADLGRRSLDAAAGDAVAVDRRDEKRAAWRDEGAIVGRKAVRGIEPGGEPSIELGEVLRYAPACGRTRGIHALDHEARGSKHAMYLGHRRYESLPLLGRYGAEQAGGQPIGPVVQLADLAPAARRRPGRPQALIAGAGPDAARTGTRAPALAPPRTRVAR